MFGIVLSGPKFHVKEFFIYVVFVPHNSISKACDVAKQRKRRVVLTELFHQGLRHKQIAPRLVGYVRSLNDLSNVRRRKVPQIGL